MDISSAENSQIDALRSFLRKNREALSVSLLIGALALIFWCYWQKDKNSAMSTLPPSYQSINAIFLNDSHINEENILNAEKFIQKNHNSYSVFIALQVAKYFIENHAFDKAQQYLISALTNTKDKNMLALIYLRLARLQLKLKQLDQALKSLDNIRSEFWLSMAEEIRGDVLLEKNDIAGARAAYNKSIELSASASQLLRLKLNNLSG